MTETTTPQPVPQTAQPWWIAAMNANPVVMLLLLSVLGAQSVDVISTTTGSSELRALRQDIEGALEAIEDNQTSIASNTARIERLEERYSDLRDQIVDIRTDGTPTPEELVEMLRRLRDE